VTRLSDLVRSEGYGFRVVPEPWREPRVLGIPPDPQIATALVCADVDGEPYVACVEDSIDHVYSASHELAEHTYGFRHSPAMLEYQANMLAAWLRRSTRPAPASPRSARPAPSTHPYRLVALCAATGAVLGAVVGWHAAGRRGQ
jgi:hypothetical protein